MSRICCGFIVVHCTRRGDATTALSVVDDEGRRVDAIRPAAEREPLWLTGRSRWRIGPLLPGEYEVTALAGGLREKRRVVLAAGESLDVELELP